MKNLLLTAALFSSFTVLAQNNIKSIQIGAEIPMANKAMKSADGKTITLEKAKTNEGLLVMFSCNTCPYVIKSEARTKEMMAYATEKKIGMVIINSNEAKRSDEDSDKEMAKYAKKMGYKVPYVIDEKSAVADAFGATRTPEVFLFDGNGKLMYKGAMEDNPSNPSESKNMFLKDAIDKITMGQVPDPNSTKSIGCTIKRM
ncbi:MAG TPA: redoxin family protein [Flavipsychrobacter sp.]|nr:redoxin family protein [Flavipsychrobacter sp.]